MYLDDLQSVIDSVNLVDEYHNHSDVKQYVNTNFLYKNNRYVTEYISHLVSFSPFFLNRWKLVTQGKAIGPKRYWNDDFKTRVGNFLEECYSNQPELKRVVNRAITSYTSTNRFSPEQLAYLRRIQSLPPESQRSGIVSYIKNEQAKDRKRKEEARKRDLALHPKGIYGAKLTPEELEAQRKIPVPLTGAATLKSAAIQAEQQRVQHLENLGEPLPSTARPAGEMEIVHAAPESQTAGKANMPISNIRQGVQDLTSRAWGERQILKPLTGEAFSRGKVAFTRFQPVKRAGDLGSGFIRQIPFLSGARGGGSVGLISRGGASVTRGVLGLATKGVGRAGARALIASPAGALFCLILALVVLPILLSMFNINDNATLCPPWLGCAKTGLAAPPGNVPGSTLLVNKDGPSEVPNDSPITYNITVTYKGVGTAKVDLTDKIPPDTKFSSANPNNTGVFERRNQDTPQETLVWHLEDIKSNQSKQVSFTVTPQKQNFWAVNNAESTVTGITGVSGQGLLCVADVDPRIIPFFEQSSVAANLSPSLMYAVAKGERHGYPITALSLDNKISISPCGAHGIMQIQHPNDGTPGAPGKYGPTCAAPPVNGTSNPPESWDPLVKDYNTATGGKLNNVDADEDNIWGSSFFVRNVKINNPIYFSRLPDYQAFKSKGPNDQYTDQEIVEISRSYLGELNQAYANFYLNAYHQALASQGTCGTPAPVPGGGNENPGGKTVVLDPGHSVNDIFKEDKALENDLNLAVANATRDLLVKNGYRVVITRPNGHANPDVEGKYYEDLQGRIDIANSNQAAAFVAIHGDNTNTGANGTVLIDRKVWAFNKQGAESSRLGKLVSDAIGQKLGFSSEAPRYDTYYLLSPQGTKTSCRPQPGQEFGLVYSDAGKPTATKCDVYEKGQEASAPTIIQEIYIGGHPYSSLNSRIPDIASGYCNGIAQFLNNKNCTN